MKKRFVAVLSFLALCIAVVFGAVGCGKSELSKEDIAYKLICSVAEDYDSEPEDVRLQSGRMTKEEDVYTVWFTVKVGSYTMYFTGEYNTETEELEYKDMTSVMENSIVGPGPAYLDTESFDIDQVNKKLKG